MATYTIELRHVCEMYGRDVVENYFTNYELSDYLTPEQIKSIEQHTTWTKEKLAEKIVDAYYTREIGSETPALFKLRAKVEMRAIMEKFLPLIYSRSIQYDPLVNVNYTETYKDINKTQGTSKSATTTSGLGVNSDTPQGQIDKAEILKGKYASSTGANESVGNDESSTEGGSTTEYTRQKIGNDGVLATAQKMVEQFRGVVEDYDQQIIERLNVLFMGVF